MGCIETKLQKELKPGDLMTAPSRPGTQIFLSSEDNLTGKNDKILLLAT